MNDPFKIDSPTCISFSGGRTSAYMLWRVLQSNGGLPPEAIVCFANTGKEREETLAFVRDCSVNFGVHINWLEWRDTESKFDVVDFDTASRDGEPFEALIRKRKYLPNPLVRFCTVELKVRTCHRFLKSIGWTEREGLSDAGNQFHYYRLTKDNEILWGGYDAIYNFRGKVRQEYESDAQTYAHLAEAFLETFPQLKGIKFTHGWGGAIDTCSRFSPFWGTAHKGRVAYVLGYTGLGVGSTRFGAQVMLDLLDEVDNERTRLRMVRKKPMPFPPEPFRFIFIRLTQWSINQADENNGKRNLWLKLLDSLGLGFDS